MLRSSLNKNSIIDADSSPLISSFHMFVKYDAFVIIEVRSISVNLFNK